MQWLSLILSLLGLSNAFSEKSNRQREKAYRLIAEVSAETNNALYRLSVEEGLLVSRLRKIKDPDSEVELSIKRKISEMRDQIEKIRMIAEENKAQLESKNVTRDLDSIILKLHEWRSTSSTINPYLDNVIKKMNCDVTELERVAVTVDTKESV